MSDYISNQSIADYESNIYGSDQTDEILSDSASDNQNDDNNTLLSSVEELNITEIGCPSCPICLRNYNTDDRVINIISDCGHSVCATCIYNIDTCPICREKISDSVINWAVHSEISKKPKRVDINPFYLILIDFKEEIELEYIRNPRHNTTLTNDQTFLLNKIKMRLQGLKIKIEDIITMLDNLMLPSWLNFHLKNSLNKIKNYKKYLETHKIANLEELLPFCP
ncbi:hypothetical protein CPAV1605_235 [seawater metagenome]|uniref:RING-type domain-containing protein n=1 Tax=seawater metagenome TaxID=1561972 RepID=A0A5E8CLV0_9ZZZZ